MKEKQRFLLASGLAPLIAFLLIHGFFLLFSETRLRLESMLLDRLFANREQVSKGGQDRILSSDLGSMGLEPIVIVTVDEKTLSTLSQKPLFQSEPWKNLNSSAWPFDRRITAEAIRRLKSYDARVIGVDLLFLHPRDKVADAELTRAVREAGNVVLATQFEKSQDQETTYLKPWPELAEAASALGYVNVPLDTDGIMRRILLRLRDQEETVLPFALQIWHLHPLNQAYDLSQMKFDSTQATLSTPDGREKPLYLARDNTSFDPMLINFRGPAGTFPTISYVDLFDPKRQESLRNLMKGKIVLIGLSHPGLQDVYPTPFYSYNKEPTPGVEIHANALFTLMSKTRPSIQIPGFWPHLFSAWLLGSIVAGITSFFSIGISMMLLFLFMGSWWVLTNLLFASHILLDVPTILLTLILSYIFAITLRMITRESEKATIRRVFNQYVSNQVVDELLMHPESLSLGGKGLEITTLFSDIRSFTSLSERKTPEQVVYLLNTYFELMVSVITKYNGTINKFIGDAVMVLYGAPVLPNQTPSQMAIQAVKTAIEMQETLKASSQGELKEIRMGIGISTGVSVVGNIGAQKHKDYTAIGDKVNLASRLQGKSDSFEIIVDSRTYEYCKELFQFEKMEPFRVKGKEELIQAYKVIY